MEEALVKRIMPHSLEAEQSVIGSMIMDKEAIVVSMEILIQEDFTGQVPMQLQIMWSLVLMMDRERGIIRHRRYCTQYLPEQVY